MWVFCRDGFFSAVQNHECRADEVMVRGRLREDVERLATATVRPQSDIVTTPDADYAFRLKLEKRVWADYLTRSAMDIDYSNFKATCATGNRAWVYGQVWSAMHDMQVTNQMVSGFFEQDE